MPFQRPVKRLFDLEIDEVSLVDKPANQFGKVAFSKRAEDEMPVLFDLDGNEVTEDELEHGESVTDEDGNEFVFFEEGSPEYDELAADVDDSYDDDEDYDDDGFYDEADDDELAGVGKAVGFKGVGRMRGAKLGYTRANAAGRRIGAPAGRAAGNTVRGARAAGRGVDRVGASYRSSRVGRAQARGSERLYQAGRRNSFKTRGGQAQSRGRRLAGAGQQAASAVGYHSYAHPGRYAAGATAAGAYGANRARKGRASKSFGGEIYEELSKALTQTDRDEAIAKALDVVDSLAEQNEELYDIVGKMADEKALNDFADLAQEYGPLPVHPARLGAIMKRAADTLPAQDVEILDRLFSSVGEQLYTEVGKSGTGDGIGVFDQVSALANDVVSKSDMTPEQAITAIFAENPDAYDEYLAEKATR